MANNLIKIIVKVGNKSKLKFSHSKVYRAITTDDLNLLHRNNNDCHVVIIENIENDEQDAVKNFIVNFTKEDAKNRVLFFIPKQNEITSGIADELDYDIYLTLNDLYNTLYNKFNVNVSTFLDDKKKLNTNELQDSMPDGLTDIFGDISENDSLSDMLKQDIEDAATVQENNNDKIDFNTTLEKKEIDEPKSSSDKINVAENDTSKNVIENYKEEINSLQIQLRDCKYDYNILLDDMKSANTRIKDLEDTLKVLKDEKEIILEQYNKIVDNSNILEDPISLSEYEELKRTIEISDSKISDLESTISTLENNVNNTKTLLESKEKEISNYKESYNSLKAELDTLNKSIESGDIHKDIVAEYEEKIALYQNEKDTALTEAKREKDRILAEAKREKDRVLSEIKQERDKALADAKREKDRVQKSHEETSEKLQEEKDSLQAELLDCRELLDSTQSRVNELEQDLSQVTKEKDALNKELSKALNNIKTSDSTIIKLKNTKETLEQNIKDLRQKLKDNNSLLSKQEARLRMFETDINTANTKLELANSSSKEEIFKLQSRINELSAKLQTTEQQLQQKEAQYTQLITKSSMEAEGNSVLLETNQALENINKTLREQLATATKEVTTLKARDTELQKSVTTYKNQCKQLNDTLKEMAKDGIGSEKAIASLNAINNKATTINKIMYNGKAQIIPVFGSGSFGITTMAMSLSYKLGATSKVLYLDFDLVAPKADAWFSKLPLCQHVPGINVNDRKMTGLGIFFEKGIQTFMTYFDNIVNECDRTKGGGIDYISGVYYKVDSNKLASADYTTFFNFLSSKYNYIVVDLGRLGSSDINDQLIKVISDISNKNVVITTSDRFEVRNFKMKITENQLRIQNIAWMLNMCEATSVDERVKKAVAPAKYGIMLYDQSLQGKRERFTRNKLNKDKLDLFINSVLFSK